MADSPSKEIGILAYSVYCNGTKLTDNYQLTYVLVNLSLNRIGKATLKFNAGNMDKQTFTETDSSSFKPGASIRLDIGNIKAEKAIFEGFIVDVRISIEKGLHSQMVVECRDCAYPATQGRKNAIFEKKKDGDIIKEVLTPYGTVTADSTTYEYPTLVQYYCTDWDFALSRADVNGLFISVIGKNISVAKPKVSAAPVLTVTYGLDLINFDGGLSTSDQFSDFEAVSWSPSTQKMVTASATTPTINKQGDLEPKSFALGEKQLLQSDAPTDAGSLKQWADSMALKAALARYQGKFSFYGSAKAVPGCIIELKGMGERFSGDVFVGSVTHTIENNVWITEAGMGVSAENITSEPDVVSPPAAGFLPGIEGLHIGVVKQLNEDPLTENRILVEFPWLNGEKKELWARLSTPYATKECGFFFLPEVKDEVIVGFFNNDPRHPVVLGSMHGSIQTPPLPYTAENHKKSIVSRQKMKIEFDDEKKIITILTPGENQIEINDEKKSIELTDQNKNKITMDSSGITLTSDKDIILKAKGDITLDATANVTIGAKTKVAIKAKADVEINGANVKATAKVGFTAKGNATAEISASGQTVVKGGIVMIN